MPSAAARTRSLLALLALAPLAGGWAHPPPPTGEALLPSGPFAVGFRSTWLLDEGRTYRTTFDQGQTYGAEKAARPLLVLLWYPARAAAAAMERMPHGGYFALADDDPRLARLARALSAHARGVFVEQVMGEAEAELEPQDRVELETLLAAPTSCRIAADPADGPFPLVVYHSGAGSSFEDNAALCEYLASHGYVVLGSAFPRADGTSFGVDAGRGSAEDVQFLVRWARTLSFVDWRRVALVGHSAGAQAMLKGAAQPGCVGDALVLLDTTQDYYSLSLPLQKELVREARAGVAQLTRPMLVAAGPEAQFALCDTLVNAERTYLTVPELGHDEYISQGLQRLERCVLQAERAERAEQGEAERAPAVRANYRALCETVRAFLQATLAGEPAEFAARLALDRARPWDPAVPCLVRVARGESAPEPYDMESDAAPTPRQFTRLMAEEGVASACEVLLRFRAAEPRGPLYSSTMLAGSLLYDLVQQGHREDAGRYYATLQQIELPALSLFEFLADMSTLTQEPAQALHFLRLAHELDPEHAGIAGKLRQLEEQGPR